MKRVRHKHETRRPTRPPAAFEAFSVLRSRDEAIGEARPAIDLDQQLGQVELGQPRLDQLAQPPILERLRSIDDQFAVGKLRFGGGVAFPREALKELALLARQRPQPLARVQRLLDGLGKRGARRLPLLGGNEQRSVRRRQAALRRWRRVPSRGAEGARAARPPAPAAARPRPTAARRSWQTRRATPATARRERASSTGRRGDGCRAPTLVPPAALSAVRRRRTPRRRDDPASHVRRRRRALATACR